jgi:hypothetical protein
MDPGPYDPQIMFCCIFTASHSSKLPYPNNENYNRLHNRLCLCCWSSSRMETLAIPCWQGPRAFGGVFLQMGSLFCDSSPYEWDSRCDCHYSCFSGCVHHRECRRLRTFRTDPRRIFSSPCEALRHECCVSLHRRQIEHYTGQILPTFASGASSPPSMDWTSIRHRGLDTRYHSHAPKRPKFQSN